MGDGADDLRDTEELWDEMWFDHKIGKCEGFPNCPFCNPDFKPLFYFQYPRDENE